MDSIANPINLNSIANGILIAKATSSTAEVNCKGDKFNCKNLLLVSTNSLRYQQMIVRMSKSAK